MTEITRQPTEALVKCTLSHNSIGRVSSILITKKPDARTFFTNYAGFPGGIKLTILVLTQWWLMGYIIGGWTFLTTLPIAVGAFLYHMRVSNIVPEGRKFGETGVYGNIDSRGHTFAKLIQLQDEIRTYILKNNVADFYVERYNELVAAANKFWGAFITKDLTPREDEILLEKLARESSQLYRDFNDIYTDMLKQADHDPENTALGRALLELKEIPAIRNERASDYSELNRVYQQYMNVNEILPRR